MRRYKQKIFEKTTTECQGCKTFLNNQQVYPAFKCPTVGSFINNWNATMALEQLTKNSYANDDSLVDTVTGISQSQAPTGLERMLSKSMWKLLIRELVLPNP
jgi:predicted RNA-binding Zn-ribbon protein involved in translation (DUF1610 family)